MNTARINRETAHTCKWRACSIIQYKYYCLFLTFIFLSIAIPGFASNKIVINTGNSEPYITEEGGGFYGLITKEIFRRMGIEAKVICVPSERSLINANNGIEDGVIARIEGLEKTYTNLIRVPEIVVDFEFIAYSRDVDFNVDGWDSLKPYHVGFIRGWKIFEKMVVGTEGITYTRGPAQLFNLLENRKIDIALYERWGGLWWTDKLKLDVHALKPAIDVKPLYIYLNKNHQLMVTEAATVLAEMKKDGTYQKIFDQTLTYLRR